MRTKKNIYLVLFVTVMTVLVAVTLAGTGQLNTWWNKQPVAEDASGNKPDPAQVALMNELIGWLKPFDTANTSYYLNGLFTAVDKADSANAMVNLPYTVCKNGNEFYLRIGQTETVNNKYNYLFVDHAVKKMMLSGAKKITYTPGVPMNEIYDYLTSEGYVLVKTAGNNRLSTISMQNPNHVSFKELAVQYDSATHQLKKVFMRQADVADPMNADREKWITLEVKDWNDDPEPGKYLDVQKFVQKKQNEWAPAAGYSSYSLINQ